MIGVVDYEAGNVTSVANALTAIGEEFVVSAEADALNRCSGIVLPGVGAAPGAMASLQSNSLVNFLQSTSLPLLGICLGMQLLYERSEEGGTRCLGVLTGAVRRFQPGRGKIPHMGWNGVEQRSSHPLLSGIANNEYFYFAHSYFVSPDPTMVGMTTEGETFASVVQQKNHMGVQFHPEKSGKVGQLLLRNFAAICKSSLP